jgi:hypothetical protein
MWGSRKVRKYSARFDSIPPIFIHNSVVLLSRGWLMMGNRQIGPNGEKMGQKWKSELLILPIFPANYSAVASKLGYEQWWVGKCEKTEFGSEEWE